MTTAPLDLIADENVPVRLPDVERELSLRMKLIQGSSQAPVLRARMSNLVIYCDRVDLADRIAAQVPSIVAIHPARVLLVVNDSTSDDDELKTSVRVRAHATSEGRTVCSEQVTLHAGAKTAGRLPFAVRGLLIGDLPTNLWWEAPQPPPLAGAMLYDLAERAQQIIYDSIGWIEPARGVAATGAWLQRMEQGEPWRVVSDLNWRRLKYWRRLLAQASESDAAASAVESITEVLVEHGPHAVVQAWEMVSWLAARLDWRIEEGKVQPGVEIAWQFTAACGRVRVSLRRLAEGPPEIRRLRIVASPQGKPRAWNLVVQDGYRLAVLPEDAAAAPRTVTVQPQPLAELIGRQLSDRAPDPVFRESMAVARILAESVLG
jgi:glucose-6-phosphate dehydrogenase assembly protein OpcA